MNNNSDSILLIDNYDSFTFNLVQLIEEAGALNLDVVKHDEVTFQNVKTYDRIVFSPGPDIPSSIPVMSKILEAFGDSKKILGVCLGHQAIGEYFGATIYQMPEVVHGIQKEIEAGKGHIFEGLTFPLNVGVYHSWAISAVNLPKELEITAVSKDGIIMGIQHRDLPITGIQFHPESYLTEQGQELMKNWLSY
ncbi:MAG: aminodeoxychorismate/anthranilate synthase component II [Saprospiraceae bacterium]|nr:aminodeoxychorismate/anthranilate synthase component II [Saprospiraceae bacterium]